MTSLIVGAAIIALVSLITWMMCTADENKYLRAVKQDYIELINKTGNDAQEYYDNLKEALELLSESHKYHYESDEIPYHSCRASDDVKFHVSFIKEQILDEGIGNEEREHYQQLLQAEELRGFVCNCGADEWNNKIDGMLAKYPEFKLTRKQRFKRAERT